MSADSRQDQIAECIGRIVSRTVSTRGAARLTGAIVRAVLTDWAGKSQMKRAIAYPAIRLLAGKKKAAPPAAPSTTAADAGTLITLIAAAVNEGRAENPDRDKARRGDAIGDFIVNTDFGEIREMVAGSEPEVLKTIEAFNEHLWKYPAKAGTLVAILIAVMNISVKSSREALRPIEEDISPDLLADIALSTVRGMDGKAAAALANTVMEIARRLHTGSLLLGKGGKPLFQLYLTDFLRECLPEIDPVLLKKMRILLAEDKEAVANALADALSANPRVASSYLASGGAAHTAAVRARSRRLRTIDDLDAENLETAVTEYATELDTYEIAEVINTALRVLNRIHDIRPDIVRTLLGGIADSVRSDEVGRTTQWLIPDVADALKPLSSAVAPSLIQGLADLINPAGGFESPAHEEAVKNLKAALTA